MKRITKVLSVMLAVIMMAGAICVPVFATDTTDNPYAVLQEGTGYVAFGDSFARGFGASDHYLTQIKNNDTYGIWNCRNVDGSYPNRIAEAFGLYSPDDIRETSAKMWPITHDAVSVAYVLDLLGVEDNYCDTDFIYSPEYPWQLNRYKTDLAYFGNANSKSEDGTTAYGKTGEIMDITEMVTNASLITIGLGQCDIIYRAQLLGLNPLLAGETDIMTGVTDTITLLWKYFDYWQSAYPLLLKYINEVNPDCKVVLVSAVNPIKNVIAADEFAIKIGSILDIIFDSMNNLTKTWAAEYGYIYVDVTDVDTPSSVKKLTLTEMLALEGEEKDLLAHPTQNGYKQLAEKIIEAVKADIDMDNAKKDFNFATFFQALFNLLKVIFSNLFGI